jgi:hypothetical protein
MITSPSDLAERLNEIVAAVSIADRIPLAQKLREEVALLLWPDVVNADILERARAAGRRFNERLCTCGHARSVHHHGAGECFACPECSRFFAQQGVE